MVEKLRQQYSWSMDSVGIGPGWDAGLTLQGLVVLETNLDAVLLTVGSH